MSTITYNVAPQLFYMPENVKNYWAYEKLETKSMKLVKTQNYPSNKATPKCALKISTT